MMIDISAIQTLEIMQNQRDHKSKDCLFGLLNHTLTPMGSRMLRNNVLQPPTEHEKFILPRYDALEELTAHEDMFRALRKGIAEDHLTLTSTYYSSAETDLRRGKASDQGM